jgi:hypothetical protein
VLPSSALENLVGNVEKASEHLVRGTTNAVILRPDCIEGVRNDGVVRIRNIV